MTSRSTGAPRGLAHAALLVACAAGLLHAAFSIYWALGGMWLLPTVGRWAVDAVSRSPLEAGLLLSAVGLVKAAAAVIPVGVAHGRIPGRRFWRLISWIGGIGLVVYGGANTVVSNAVLLGAIRPEGGYDGDAMIGHALLWDPLFLVWGAALVTGLSLSRERRRR